MHAGNKLGIISAIVDHRFVQAAEASAGIRKHVIEADGFKNVHHEIRPGTVDRSSFGNGSGTCRRRDSVLRLLSSSIRGLSSKSRRTSHGASQKTTAIYGALSTFGQESPHGAVVYALR